MRILLLLALFNNTIFVCFKQRNGKDVIVLWMEEDTMRDRCSVQNVRIKIW